MANTFVSLRRLQQFYSGLKNKFALKTDIPDSTSDLTNDSGFVTENTTYSLSISNNVITLTDSNGNITTATLPIYDGGVS